MNSLFYLAVLNSVVFTKRSQCTEKSIYLFYYPFINISNIYFTPLRSLKMSDGQILESETISTKPNYCRATGSHFSSKSAE